MRMVMVAAGCGQWLWCCIILYREWDSEYNYSSGGKSSRKFTVVIYSFGVVQAGGVGSCSRVYLIHGL